MNLLGSILDNFLGAVDKLGDLEIDINQDLFTVILLRSLPSNYEILRWAKESRDSLSLSEAPKTKTLEESEARNAKYKVAIVTDLTNSRSQRLS